MIYSSKDMESRAVLDTAAKICAAARTAPKTRGMDGLVTCVLTGEDKSQLAAQMRNLADELDYAFFNRDADNVDASDAVVLFGMEEVRRGLDAGCQYCHFESCADCTEKDGLCAWDAIDIGIAIGAGTDVAIDAADVVLMNSKLSDVPAAIRLSRAALRNIHENLFWAFIYNIIGIPLAAGVFIPFGLTLNPMFGAAAMSLSSFCVVSNALRLNLFDVHSTKHDRAAKNAASLPAVSAQPAAVANKESTKEDTAMKKTLKVEGMMCGHCEARVKKALEALPEVDEAVVSHEAGTAIVTLNAEVADDVLKKAVEDQDYPVTGIQ
mgnify:CR=1 FL=1